ncbi:hypothetical protein BLNAU_3367 [Blattamonas nauphoetae]|uniref:Uncharacterized protein n=1 Tax=Blattamonas nauphoetae TaxID=2049346 RepID=A0ABQ9YCW1_9EUKA|nr:hypothetical protein BLNAU_3367 [Blattamonas nauphoetae]
MKWRPHALDGFTVHWTFDHTLPFSLPPCLSLADSVFDGVSLRIDAMQEDTVETGTRYRFVDDHSRRAPLSSYLFPLTCVVPPSASLIALTSHTLAVRFLPSQNITTFASPLSAVSVDYQLLVKILSTNEVNHSFLFDDTLRQSPLSSQLELVGVEMEAATQPPLARALHLRNVVSVIFD